MSEEPIYHYDIEQGGPEWLHARKGMVTASEVNSLITPKGKACTGAKVKAYACKKAAERLTNSLGDHYESWDMQRGHFQEVIARRIYNESYYEVEECGLITRKINGVLVGVSPDGLVGVGGGIEIKSRLEKFQVETIIADEVPAEYVNQIQTALMVSGRHWWDFVQYSNGMSLYVKRVEHDLVRQAEIMAAIVGVEKMIVEMCEKYAVKSASFVPTERVEIEFGDIAIKESVK